MLRNRVTGISFKIVGQCVGMHPARSIPSFVDPQFRASIGAGRNRQVEAVVLSYLPGVRAGACADRCGNDLFPPPEPREHVLRGIARHDDGWAARDAVPQITRQRKPSAFSTELVGKYSGFSDFFRSL
jgi:hypothetical protein